MIARCCQWGRASCAWFPHLPFHQGQQDSSRVMYCSLELPKASPLKGCRSAQCACMAPASCCGFNSPCCSSRIAHRCCQRACTCNGDSTPLFTVEALTLHLLCQLSGSVGNSFEPALRPSYSSDFCPDTSCIETLYLLC